MFSKLKQKIIILVLLLFFLPRLFSQEVFTLTKENTVTCVLTEESVYSALFLSAANEKVQNRPVKRSLDLLDDWIFDDWNNSSSREHSFRPVTDIRWEVFAEKSSTNITLNDLTAFSIRINNKVVYIYDDDSVGHIISNSNSSDIKWTHFFAQEKDIFQFPVSGDKSIAKLNNSFIFSETNYKKHDYNFRYSYNATGNKNNSILNVTNVGCISFFVSVDKGCYLNITLEADSVNKTSIEGFNTEDIRTWKRVTVKINSYNGTGKLIFHRGGKSTGFWAIDRIHLCKPKIDTFTIISTLANSYRCKTLEQRSNFSGEVLCPTPGSLGENCSTNCTTIFGSTYPFCEGHRICSEDKCECAWGYEGDFCNKKCDNGFWGLKCASKYNFNNCKNYSNILGCTKCKDGISGKTCSKLFPVTNITVFSSNKTVVWLKWKPPYPSTKQEEFYKITYQSFPDEKALFINSTSGCLIWAKFKCAYIKGLKPNTSYNISIQVKIVNMTDWSKPTFFNVFTKENLSNPLENLHLDWFSKTDKLVLKWEHPQYTFGILEKFVIDVNNQTHGEVEPRQEPYEYNITVESNKKYFVSVLGVAQKNLTKATLNITTFAVLEEISQYPLIQGCNKTCYLFVPNEKSLNIAVEIDGKEMADASNSKVVIVKLNDSLDNIDILCSNKSLDFLTLSITTTKISSSTVNEWTIVITLLIFTFFVILACLYFIFKIYSFWKHFRFCRKKLRNDLEENIPLQPQNCPTFIKLKDLENYVKNFHDKKNIKQLEDLFLESLHNKNICNFAMDKKNLNKNKDQEHIPCDSTRVVLEDLEGVSCGDYINASYIDDYQHSQLYIACQSPKFNTVLDFWRMIWTKHVDSVVMATKFLEKNGDRNCAEYWSQGLNIVAEFGTLTVKMISEEVHQYYIFRIFEVSYSGCVRQLRHLQAKWTQDRCPHPEEVLAVLQKLWSFEKHAPVVVHSGFGTNRTGMLILCDLAIRMIKTEGHVDFIDLLKKLRVQRPLIIHRFEYFILAYLVVLECLLDERNPYKQNLDDILVSNYEEQVYFLDRLSRHDRALLCQKKTDKTATFVDDYHGNQKFMFQPHPQPKAMFEFWKNILLSDVEYILSPNLPKDQLNLDTVCKGKISLSVEDVETNELSPDCIVRQLLLTQRNTIRNCITKQKTVWLYELMDWKSKKNLPNTNINFLALLEHLRKTIKNNNKIVLLLCTKTNASAITAIGFNAIEKFEYERKVDVYSFLRVMMRNDQNFKLQPIELKFIYAAITDFLKNFDLKTQEYEDVK